MATTEQGNTPSSSTSTAAQARLSAPEQEQEDVFDDEIVQHKPPENAETPSTMHIDVEESLAQSSEPPGCGLNPTQQSPTAGVCETSPTELVLFFGSGLGSSLCYISTLSSLVYFMMIYGPDSYVYLNLAVYLPLVPISLTQARYDQEMDKIFRSYRTYLFRGIVGFSFSIAGTALIPNHSGMVMLIFAASLQGIGGAILLGTLNQMASFVGTSNGKCKACVSSGVQASALVILCVSIATEFGSSASDAHLRSFFLTVVVLESICFAMFLILMTTRPPVTASMLRRDASIINLAPLLSPIGEPATYADQEDGSDIFPDDTRRDLSYTKLVRSTWRCCATMLITLVPSFLVGSWFTQVRTQWLQLPQVLFYVRIGSDFVGRVATVLMPPTSVVCLGWASLFRLIPVALFFWYSSFTQGSDHLTIALVSIIAFLSGYLVTGCFQLAPALLSDRLRDANVSKQASLLNVAFSVAALGGILASFILVMAGF